MAARVGAQRLSLLKRGWHEGPEVVISIALTVVGCAIAGAGMVVKKQQGERNFMYKDQYTVIRDTDVTDTKKLGDLYN